MEILALRLVIQTLAIPSGRGFMRKDRRWRRRALAGVRNAARPTGRSDPTPGFCS
jgi:hypothetical protein